MPGKIVDIHPHIVSPDTQRYPATPVGGIRSKWSIERPATFERLVASMDEAEIAKAAIVHASTVYGFNNDYLADAIAGQGARFTGVFSVDLLAEDAPQKMRYWYSKNLTGMRIYFGNINVATDRRLDDPRSFPAWECAQDLGISVCISRYTAKQDELLAMVRRYPKLKLVIDCPMAPIEEGPPYAGSAQLFDLGQYESVYLKVHTNIIRASRRGNATPESFFLRLVAAFGASRIAWGSNFPASKGTLAEIVNEAKSALAVLSLSDQEWIFHRTAISLYPALAD